MKLQNEKTQKLLESIISLADFLNLDAPTPALRDQATEITNFAVIYMLLAERANWFVKRLLNSGVAEERVTVDFFFIALSCKKVLLLETEQLLHSAMTSTVATLQQKVRYQKTARAILKILDDISPAAAYGQAAFFTKSDKLSGLSPQKQNLSTF